MASCLILDDEADARFVVRLPIEESDNAITVLAEASSGEETVHCWRAFHPDFVILDQRMPGGTGLGVADHVLAEDPVQRLRLTLLDLLSEPGQIGTSSREPADEPTKLPGAFQESRA